MSSIKVIAGELKGRTIPFPIKMLGNSSITSQKVKGAIFSIIGEWLEGSGFLDLFAGSGQVGIEALSRGADPIVLNEKDWQRYSLIKSFIDKLVPSHQPLLLNFDYLSAIDFLKNRSIMFSYIFLDPPYHKSSEDVPQYRQILEKIGVCDILEKQGKIIVQHFSDNILLDEVGAFGLIAKKRYGKNSLAIYGYF